MRAGRQGGSGFAGSLTSLASCAPRCSPRRGPHAFRGSWATLALSTLAPQWPSNFSPLIWAHQGQCMPTSGCVPSRSAPFAAKHVVKKTDLQVRQMGVQIRPQHFLLCDFAQTPTSLCFSFLLHTMEAFIPPLRVTAGMCEMCGPWAMGLTRGRVGSCCNDLREPTAFPLLGEPMALARVHLGGSSLVWGVSISVAVG